MAGAIDLDNRGLVIACPTCGQKNRLAYERLADSLRCGKCKQAISAPSTPIDVHSSEDFDRLVAHASLPIVVDYWAPWCGPCRMVAPELQKVASRLAGTVLVHNRVEHTASANPFGAHGFRAWVTRPTPHFVACSCGWQAQLGAHYRVASILV